MMRDDGKWQIAFWLSTAFFIIVVTFIGNAVIANDKTRESGDKEIACKLEVFQKEVITRLTRIETLITDGKK